MLSEITTKLTASKYHGSDKIINFKMYAFYLMAAFPYSWLQNKTT